MEMWSKKIIFFVPLFIFHPPAYSSRCPSRVILNALVSRDKNVVLQLYNSWCKRFRNTRHTITSNEVLPKLLHCSGWLGVAHRTSCLNKILVPRVNCRPTGKLLAILRAKFPLNLCSRLRFFEPKKQRARFAPVKVIIFILTAGALEVAVLGTTATFFFI
jgi:hypothetical protein